MDISVGANKICFSTAGKGEDPLVLLCLESLNDGVVRGLGSKFVVVRKRCTLAREHVWNPRVLVACTPNGHTDAAADRQTRVDDRLVVSSLLCERGSVGWGRHADIEFGNAAGDGEVSVCTGAFG